MTILKLQGKPSTVAMAALAPHIARLYAHTGIRCMAVVELAHIERTEPAPESDKDASVTLRISHLEMPAPDQEGVLREVQRALYLQRTATGKLDEDNEVALSRQTLDDAAGMVQAIAVARYTAGVRHWEDYTRRVAANDKATVTELHHELDLIAEGLRALREGTVAP